MQFDSKKALSTKAEEEGGKYEDFSAFLAALPRKVTPPALSPRPPSLDTSLRLLCAPSPSPFASTLPSASAVRRELREEQAPAPPLPLPVLERQHHPLRRGVRAAQGVRERQGAARRGVPDVRPSTEPCLHIMPSSSASSYHRHIIWSRCDPFPKPCLDSGDNEGVENEGSPLLQASRPHALLPATRMHATQGASSTSRLLRRRRRTLAWGRSTQRPRSPPSLPPPPSSPSLPPPS